MRSAGLCPQPINCPNPRSRKNFSISRASLISNPPRQANEASQLQAERTAQASIHLRLRPWAYSTQAPCQQDLVQRNHLVGSENGWKPEACHGELWVPGTQDEIEATGTGRDHRRNEDQDVIRPHSVRGDDQPRAVPHLRGCTHLLWDREASRRNRPAPRPSRGPVRPMAWPDGASRGEVESAQWLPA